MEKIFKNIEFELNASLKEFEELISSLNEEQLNILPVKGGWTSGQIARHIIKVNTGFLKQLNGPVKETNRKVDNMAEDIRVSLLDFNTKLISPDPVVPESIAYKKEDLINSLIELNCGYFNSVESLDMTKTCLLFKVPVLGYLTRLEVIYFVTYHTQRHIHQLKNTITCIETNRFI